MSEEIDWKAKELKVDFSVSNSNIIIDVKTFERILGDCIILKRKRKEDVFRTLKCRIKKKTKKEEEEEDEEMRFILEHTN